MTLTSDFPALEALDPDVEAPTDGHRTSFTADRLMAMVFPEPRWAVPGVLPEGLTVFAGAPKVGKSWLALNLAASTASGGRALGKVGVTAGDVLYLALEDTPRRLQQRLGMILAGDPAPSRLTVATECEPLTEGGVDRIGLWLDRNDDARLVIVDVFAKVRPQGSSDRADRYLADYHAVAPLKELADRHGVAILLLHHTRKAASEDFLETVSGTQGIAGAADTVLVLARARNAADAVLSITGRDVDESEHAMSFDGNVGTWTLLDGPASDWTLSDTRRAILDAVRAEEGIGPKELAVGTGMEYELVKKTMQRMAKDDQIDTDGQGHYFPVPPPPLSLVSPLSPSPSDGDSRDSRDTPDGDRDDRTPT